MAIVNGTRVEIKPTGAANATAEKPKVEKVINGGVELKKKSGIRALSSSFIKSDWQTVADYVVNDKLIPYSKELLISTLSMFLFGNDRGANTFKSGNGSIIQYNKMSKTLLSGVSRANDNQSAIDVDDVILDRMSDAIDVRDRLLELISVCGTASVADLYDTLGETAPVQAHKWGWRKLGAADIRPTTDGRYRIIFPRPTYLG